MRPWDWILELWKLEDWTLTDCDSRATRSWHFFALPLEFVDAFIATQNPGTIAERWAPRQCTVSCKFLGEV